MDHRSVPSVEIPEPQNETTSRVAEGVRVLLRTERTLRTYPIDNELSLRALSALGSSLLPILPLSLEVTPDTFRWEGTALLHAASERSDLPARLYGDGIRRIELRPGLEGEELRRLVRALATPIHPDSISEDYVTQIWEADLPHVRVLAIDPFLDLDVPEEVLEGKDVPSDQVEEVGEVPGLDVPAPPDEAFRIPPEERTAVTTMVEQAQRHPPWSAFIGALLDVLRTSAKSDRVAEVVQLLEATFYRLLTEGAFQFSAELLLRLIGCVPGHARVAVDEALGRMAHPDRLSPVLAGLSSQECSAEDAERLLLLLGERVPESLCALLSATEDRRSCRILIDALTKLGAAVVEPALAALHAGPSRSRHCFVRVLGQIPDRNATVALIEAVGDPDPAVRREAVRGLATARHESGKAQALEAALHDPEPSVRIAALRALGEGRTELETGGLLDRVRSAEFARLVDEEKDLLFRALGGVPGQDVIVYLSSCLRSGWLPGRGDSRQWRRAASALARMESASARAVLEKRAERARGELATICREALSRARGPS